MIGGSLAATMIAIFIIPALYVLVERIAGTRKGHEHAPAAVSKPETVEAD